MITTNHRADTTGLSVATAVYQIDPAHTTAQFSVKHMMFATVKGRFTKVAGEIVVDEADPSRSSVVAQVETASVDTGDEKRDAHLRSADFFFADEYPTISLRSTRVEPLDEHTGRVTGELTIHGVTREVVFAVAFLGQGTDPWGQTRIGLSASTTINRKDFGLQWNVALESGGWLVGDSVTLNLDVEAVKQS